MIALVGCAVLASMMWTGCVVPGEEVLPRTHVTIVRENGVFDFPGEMDDVSDLIRKFGPNNQSLVAFGLTDRDDTGVVVARHALILDYDETDSNCTHALFHIIAYVVNGSMINDTDAILSVNEAWDTRVMRVRFGAFERIEGIDTTDELLDLLVEPGEVELGCRIFNLTTVYGIGQDTQQYGKRVTAFPVVEEFTRLL